MSRPGQQKLRWAVEQNSVTTFETPRPACCPESVLIPIPYRPRPVRIENVVILRQPREDLLAVHPLVVPVVRRERKNSAAHERRLIHARISKVSAAFTLELEDVHVGASRRGIGTDAQTPNTRAPAGRNVAILVHVTAIVDAAYRVDGVFCRQCARGLLECNAS
jgi:hypothetical protein